MSNRAQGTIEYLVVIGVVVVISLVVVGLMTSFVGDNNTAKTAKKIGAYSSTISITDAAMDASGDAVFVARSNQGNDLTLTSVTVNGNTPITNTSQISQSRNSKVEVSGIASSCCLPGESGSKDCQVVFNYSTPNISSLSTPLTVTVECVDDVTVNGSSPQLDTTPPTVHLISPTTNYLSYNSSVTFSSTATDNVSVSNCTLKINNVDVNSNPRHVGNYFNFTQNLSSYSNAIYSWKVTCTDGNGNVGNSVENNDLNLWVFAPPVVYLTYPSNASTLSSFDFIFSASNDAPIESCSLIIDGIVKRVISNPALDTNIRIYLFDTGLSAASHTWDVNCVSRGAVGFAHRSFTNPFSSYGTISSCGVTLSEANKYYWLTGNLSSTGTCITLGADGIGIDGNGYNKYSIAGNGTGYGIDASVSGAGSRANVYLNHIRVNTFQNDFYGPASANNYYSNYLASNLTLLDSNVNVIRVNGGGGGGGGNGGSAAGRVTLIDSNVVTIYAYGANGYVDPCQFGCGASGSGGSNGGIISLTNSNVSTISGYGGNGGSGYGNDMHARTGGTGATVSAINSRIGSITAYGGTGGVSYPPGNNGGAGGTITFNICQSVPKPTINVNGGSPNGAVGTITPSDCHS
jgi:hypothetical protein